MASALDVIQAFIKLGTIVKSAASKSGSKDWGAVLASILSDPTVSKAVSDLYNQVKGQGGIDAALGAIREKESEILKKAGVSDASGLHGRALLDYHALADAEVALATQKLIGALDPNFLDWLVKDALPAIVAALPLLTLL